LDTSDHISREKVFSEYRNTIQLIFNASPNLSTALPAFFDHSSHCEHHFEHLSGISIVKNIEEELEVQMSNIKSVLNVWCTNEAANKRLQTADLLSKEQSGSQIPLYVCHLRELNFALHKRLDGLIRFAGEKETNSPHIVCHDSSDPLLFDIHFEQKKVLQDLSFPCALASFFHIVFIGQRKYPSEAEAVAILLQRRVAKIDEEGKEI
jgi:hypothetical protein